MSLSRAMVETGIGRSGPVRTAPREGAELSPDPGRSGPLVQQRTPDGSRVVPLTVMVFVVLDVITTLIGQSYGVSDLGPTGVLPTVQSLLVVAAAAATMWQRPRIAAVLIAVVVLIVFTAGPSGQELWLVMILGVTVAVRASWWQIVLLVIGQLLYAGCFAFLAERRRPGWGWDAGLIIASAAGTALVVGLAARWLLAARDRRRQRVQEFQRQQTQIRALERTRLADELQAVVTQGLASIRAELAGVGPGQVDLNSLRTRLSEIDRHSRSLLTELRVLLEVLRREPADDTDRSPLSDPAARRWVDLLTARHVRLTAAAIFALLAVRVPLGGGSSLDPETWVHVIGLLACAVAVWRPRVGAGCAAAVLLVSIVLEADGGWDALSTTLLCLMGAYRFGPRKIWLIVLALTVYAGALAVTDRVDVGHFVLLGYLGFLGIAAGLTARHFVAAREASVRQLVDLTHERERMASEERSAVARELHDVVAHQISVTTMLVMATSMSDDCAALANTVDRIRTSTEVAQHELSTLLFLMRGPEAGSAGPPPLISPVVTAQALAVQLSENGYQPVLKIDPDADGLDSTTQRTLGRIMQEGVTNILRYTPAGSRCQVTLTVDDVGARLSIVSPLGASERKSDLSLGWGLRGIRERVELTHGTLTAGPDRDRWVLEVSLPTVLSLEPLRTS